MILIFDQSVLVLLEKQSGQILQSRCKAIYQARQGTEISFFFDYLLALCRLTEYNIRLLKCFLKNFANAFRLL